ncbi:class I SAM-dependent methyltransferase [Amycolatopsis benzoatilytica]|uniref:class I SAM-dependent methyltransferase n=1 Tax=Amycolatopsis benzoatilytica TaxID=346045 RepID=UPI00036C5C3F|nr:class I SAM-dependent methyltransferase [Amycolatopsis benzoatilytica]
MGSFDYDGELRHYDARLREAADVRPTDHILDIGCGAGQTTRAAARRAVRGSALGVDISAEMIARARVASRDVPNVRFVEADAQNFPFPTGTFTLGLSRFGTMFFADPAEAFAGIARALRPGARLVQLVWQDRSHQEWARVIHEAITPDSVPAAGAAFSLSDPAVVRDFLARSGFSGVKLADVHEPVWYGKDPDAALDGTLSLLEASDRLAGLDRDQRKLALDRLRAAIVDHYREDGVWFDARAWLVTAVRA